MGNEIAGERAKEMAKVVAKGINEFKLQVIKEHIVAWEEDDTEVCEHLSRIKNILEWRLRDE